MDASERTSRASDSRRFWRLSLRARLLLLVVATGGWAVHVLWIGTAIFLFGAIHYMLWGRLMLQQTAGEREEEEVRRRAEEREQKELEASSNGYRRSP